MKAQLESIIKPLPGKIGVYYKDLSTGQTFEYNAQETFIAASVIKLPILVAVFQEIEDGSLRRDDILVLTDADKVPSCGALNQMHSGLEVTISDLCNLMITSATTPPQYADQDRGDREYQLRHYLPGNEKDQAQSPAL